MPRVLNSAPIGEEDMVVKIISSGSPIPVYAHYDRKDRAPVATLQVKPGKVVPHSEHRLVVDLPRKIRARKTLALAACAVPLKADALKHDCSPAELKLSAGDELSLLMYGGEGECLISFKGSTYWSHVTDPEQFSAPGWDGECRAEQEQWWIKVKGGWAEVDGVKLKGKLVMWNE